MVSKERLEIIEYILNRKSISIELIKSLLAVDDLKNITKGQAFALEQLLGILWVNIILENTKYHLEKVLLSL